MQDVTDFAIDRTEVTVGQFRRFVEATGLLTRAEAGGGGLVYAAGWEPRPGWTWRTPYGAPAAAGEPAVHVTFDEAQAFCRWSGKRLPTDEEWVEAAYTEHRAGPPDGFRTGHVYRYPTGDSPLGANCLDECGPSRSVSHRASLERGTGHAMTGTTRAGVNGLFDMGANVWEWVDTGEGGQRRTRGGSWWYGAAQMERRHVASKPRDMAVVYIGFRCVKDLP
jgi:formylglycine-generating enzyme required for sulfatase activity